MANESGGSGGRPGSPQLRGVALAVVLLSVGLCLYTVWLVGRPLFWRVYADLTHKPTMAAGECAPGMSRSLHACVVHYAQQCHEALPAFPIFAPDCRQ